MNEADIKKIIDRYFISTKNQKTCVEVLNMAVEAGTRFKTGEKTDNPVLTYKSQDHIKSEILEPLPINAMPIEKVLSEYNTKILNGSVNFSSPNFMAFPDCGNAIASNVGHILMGLTNQNLINSVHTSPTATFAEIAVINWLREIVGYKVIKDQKGTIDVGGIATTGGVSSNTIGLLLAREYLLKGTMKSGLTVPTEKIKVFIPKGIGHYSIKAAVGWLGIGQDNVVEVMTTRNFMIDQKDLVRKLEHYKAIGCYLMAIVAYTGDSRTMAIDDLEEISKIAKKYNTWFHVDACHGLSLCFSDEMKKKVKGIELADSVTIDPHKVLFTPYTLSFLLLKDPKMFSLVSGVSDLITKEPFSLGQITPFFGSRSFESLKLWFLIKNLGTKNIGHLIDYRHEMTKYFSSLINNSDEFIMMNEVAINSAVFLYVPSKIAKNIHTDPAQIAALNNINKKIFTTIFEEGKYYIHTFKLNDFRNSMRTGYQTEFQVLRLMLGNPLTNKGVLDDFFVYLKETARKVYLENE